MVGYFMNTGINFPRYWPIPANGLQGYSCLTLIAGHTWLSNRGNAKSIDFYGEFYVLTHAVLVQLNQMRSAIFR